MFVVSNC